MAPAAVRFVAGSGRKLRSMGFLQLQLRVKPGTSRDRQGISAVTESVVELCVAAEPRDGEANDAAISVLSSVVGIAKSRFQIAHGLKSRDKIVTIDDVSDADGPDYANAVFDLLRKAGDPSSR